MESVEIMFRCDDDSWYVNPAEVSLSKPLHHLQLSKRPLFPL